MSDFIRVDGLKELDAQLAGLGTVAGFKALRGGMMGASRPMFQAIKANANATGIRGFDAGSTAAAMGRWTRKTTPTRTTLFIGPRNKNKKALALWNAKHNANITRLNHFHLVEFGSINGPAQPFMRPGFETTKLIVVQNFARELRKSIAKQAASGRRAR